MESSSAMHQAPGRAPGQARHNLAEPLTSFVGRGQEIAATCALLGQTRLVTLVGAGGVGKTRLARRVGLGLVGAYPEGAWLVELAPLADAATIPAVIAATLGIREEPGRAILETVADGLGSRGRLLLIVDNCEHVVEGVAAIVARLLRACPELTVLATSREALGVDGETVRRVPSLQVPDDAALTSRDIDAADMLAGHDATRLFVERAQAAQQNFRVTHQNAGLIAQICRRLDGIPLAIELAAARARVLTPQQIAARLDDRFHLLTDGSRTALPRQRTLRAAIDWSYELLPEPERVLLQRLAAFAGGCTLEAADAIAADGTDTLDLLGRLADKSLVTVDLSGDEARYGLLETIREYALEHLEASGEAEQVRRRHAAHFLALAEQIDAGLWGPDQSALLDRCEAEHDNFRTALSWTQGAGQDPTTALRLATALAEFWLIRIHLGELTRLEAALAAPLPEPADVDAIRTRATALYKLADALRYRGDQAHCVALCEESVSLFSSIGDRAGLAMSLSELGFLLRGMHAYEQARAAAEESLGLARDAGDWRVLGWALYVLASVLWFEHYTSEIDEPNLAPGSRADGDTRDPAGGRRMAGASEAALGARALGLLDESLAIYREHGDVHHMAIVLGGGGSIGAWALTLRDFPRAEAAATEALALHARVGAHRDVADALRRLARVASGLGQHRRAARLVGASDAWYGSTRTRPLPMFALMIQRSDALIRARMDDRDFTRAFAEGGACSLEQAIAYALRQNDPFGDDETVAAMPGPPAPASGRDAAALTPREREVAILVGRGYTNRRIAEQLVIAEKTAEVHARNIREKLGLETRAALAAWVARHGLLDEPTR